MDKWSILLPESIITKGQWLLLFPLYGGEECGIDHWACLDWQEAVKLTSG